jgi:copper homeostasis protein
MVEEAKRVATIPFHVIVRPRGGDFLYSEIEFAAILADVCALPALGVAGVVVGCLTVEGAIDETRIRVEAACPRAVGFRGRSDEGARSEYLEAVIRGEQAMAAARGRAEVIIGKHRHRSVKLAFKGEFTRFSNRVRPCRQGAEIDFR